VRTNSSRKRKKGREGQYLTDGSTTRGRFRVEERDAAREATGSRGEERDAGEGGLTRPPWHADRVGRLMGWRPRRRKMEGRRREVRDGGAAAEERDGRAAAVAQRGGRAAAGAQRGERRRRGREVR
jgi:hypothetical protein